jgi:nucleotide-binding universal stress UspA family protein
MYSRVLAPLDGSALAERVLPYARLVAASLGSRLELFRVVEPPPLGDWDLAQGMMIPHAELDQESDVLEYLDIAAARLRRSGLPVSRSFRTGDPASQIVKIAEAEEDTLVAMSTRGRSGMTRWLMGSVTDKVLRGTTCSMLIVRGMSDGVDEDDLKIRRIVAPLDGSRRSERALPPAVSLAKALSVGASLVYAMQRETDGSEPEGNTPAEDGGRQGRVLADEYLEEIADELRQGGLGDVEQHVEYGDPAEVIVDFAEETEGCLIAMATHGRSPMQRWLLGSVTDRVTRHSSCPVLVVRST